MYLSKIKLWNFRKYGSDGELDLNRPNLEVPFSKGINILVGENDSGKTAIIDAIKLVLKTHAMEWIRVEPTDFYVGSKQLRIELYFDDLDVDVASRFTEWLSWKEESNLPYLRLVYKAQILHDRIIPSDVTAGSSEDGKILDAAAREYLKCTYLKALRDASGELTAKRNSRISQILRGHELFQKQEGEDHQLETIVRSANEAIKEWLNKHEVEEGETSSHYDLLKGKLDAILCEFVNTDTRGDFFLADPELRNILDSLSISIEQMQNPGLGTQNRLYMATELLHLNADKLGLALCLVEELEAHLHPQAQMKVITSLQNKDVQFILSTHSPNLTSKLKLSDEKNNFLLCYNSDVYPLNTSSTRLDEEDCRYLDHFLDVTKSNLFFAKGVILVEGWAEEILLPKIAKKLGLDLTQHEVSVVNVGSTAYFRYANVFIRNDKKILDIPVSVVTDLDISPKKLSKEEGEDDTTNYAEISTEDELRKRSRIIDSMHLPEESNVKMFIASHWTLEWCLFQSQALGELFRECAMSVHSKAEEFKKNNGSWDDDKFKNKLIEKLQSRTLDKVAIAQKMADELDELPLVVNEEDSAYYLVAALKHACKVKQNDNGRVD
ncbi:MAG: AAA family ATPase [Prevotellaceae bacterium]|nr:AAA family ATPase [Candidatus Faecinaster equi]